MLRSKSFKAVPQMDKAISYGPDTGTTIILVENEVGITAFFQNSLRSNTYLHRQYLCRPGCCLFLATKRIILQHLEFV